MKVQFRSPYPEVEGVAERRPNGLGEVRLDLVSPGESPPPTAVWDRFRLGRFNLLAERNGVLRSMAFELGVEVVGAEEMGRSSPTIIWC